MKAKLLLTVTLLAVFVIGMAVMDLILIPLEEQADCECMGRQPYITTRYHEGRCLMEVVSYEELDIVQYLFICEGRCR